MFEKVNPKHPDKLADRIAGAIVDEAYRTVNDPKIAVEVLLGHGVCHIIAETSRNIDRAKIEEIVCRIVEDDEIEVIYDEYKQDEHLSRNQCQKFRCGDNGIFKGVPTTQEQKDLSEIAKSIYYEYPYDGKYILDDNKLVICQSNAKSEEIKQIFPKAIVNPLGEWTGGINVDTGATNRKLGSDMGNAVTGGGLHGKDLSKADVTLNIYAHLKAQKTGKIIELSCAIGDEKIDGKPYSELVDIARDYILSKGGFEKFAEWGLI